MPNNNIYERAKARLESQQNEQPGERTVAPEDQQPSIYERAKARLERSNDDFTQGLALQQRLNERVLGGQMDGLTATRASFAHDFNTPIIPAATFEDDEAMSAQIDDAIASYEDYPTTAERGAVEAYNGITDNILNGLERDNQGRYIYNGVPYEYNAIRESLYPVVASRSYRYASENVDGFMQGQIAREYGQSYQNVMRDYLDRVIPDLEARIREMRDEIAEEERGDFHSREAFISPEAYAGAFIGNQASVNISTKPYDDLLERIASIRDNDFSSGFDEGFDWANVYTLGLADLGWNIRKENVLSKVENGEALTQREQLLFDLMQFDEDIASLVQESGYQFSLGNKVGTGLGVTTEMALPMMMTMGATNGIGTMGRLGSWASAKVALRGGVKATARFAGRNALTLGRNVGLAYARGAAAAPFMPSTWAGYTEERLSQYRINEDGSVKFTPKNDAMMFLGAYIDSMNEITSEHIGVGIGDIITGGTSLAGRLFSLANRGTQYLSNKLHLDRVGQVLHLDGLGRRIERSGVGRGMREVVSRVDSPVSRRMLANLGYAGAIAEPLSEIYGDLSANAMRDLAGLSHDYSQFSSPDYWLSTALVSTLYGGALTLPGRTAQLSSVARLGTQRRRILERISNEELTNKLLSITRDGGLDRAAIELANIDWSQYSAADRAYAFDFVRLNYSMMTIAGATRESQRMAQYMANMRDLTNRVYKDGDSIVTGTDADGNTYYVIDGVPNDVSEGSMLSCVDATTGERKTMLASQFTVTSIESVEDVMNNRYVEMFSAEIEQERLRSLINIYEQLESPAEEDVEPIMNDFGVPKMDAGTAIKLTDGREGVVDSYLGTGKYLVRVIGAQGVEVAEVPFYSILSSDTLTQQVQGMMLVDRAHEEASIDEGQPTNEGSEIRAESPTPELAQSEQPASEVEAQQGNVNVVEDITSVPTREDGSIDYDAIESPEQYAQLYKQEAGSVENAIADTQEMREAVEREITKEEERAQKASSPNVKLDARKKAEALRQRVSFFDRVLEILTPADEITTNESIPVAPQVETPQVDEVETVEMPRFKEGDTVKVNGRLATIVDASEEGVYTVDYNQMRDSSDVSKMSLAAVLAEDVEAAEEETVVEDAPKALEVGLVQSDEAARLKANWRKALDDVAKAFGVELHIERGVRDAEGKRVGGYIDGRRVYIEVNNKSNPLWFLVGHEVGHRMKDLAPEVFEQFKQSVMSFIGKKAWNTRKNKMVLLYEAHGKSYDDALIEEEVVADVIGELVQNENLFMRYAKKNANNNVLMRALRHVLNVISKVLARIGIIKESRHLNGLVDKLKVLMDSAIEAQNRGAEVENDQQRDYLIGERGTANLDIDEEATVRLDNLAIAREMETAGKDAEAIKRATGWERGADGLWRYEVDDNITPAMIDTLRERGDEGMPLVEMLGAEHPLMVAYPELHDVRTVMLPYSGEGYGAFIPERHELVMFDTELNLPTLAHELQHAVQTMEGFAIGGSPMYMKPDISKDVANYQQVIPNALNGATMRVDDASLIDVEKFAQAVEGLELGGTAKRYADWLKAQGNITYDDAVAEYNRLLSEVSAELEDARFEMYERISGEVEARNVARRLGMTPEERRTTLARLTEDVAREEQIFFERASAITDEESIELDDLLGDISFAREVPESFEGADMAMAQFKFSLSEEQISSIIEAMKANAEVVPQIELTPENWLAEFGAEGIVSTPIGEVKMGDGQYQKLIDQNREQYFGYIKPTLTNPDAILEEYDAKEGAERDTKMLFVKTFIKSDGGRYVHFASVTVRKDNLEVSISSHEVKEKKVKEKMHNDNVVHLNETLLDSEWRLTKPQNKGSDLVPTPSVISKSKDTTSIPENQTNVGKFSLITPEMDAFYLDAVERGDMEAAQRMVLETAKLAMPDTKVAGDDGNPKVVYHGDRKKARYIFSTDTFFTPKAEYAKRYTNGTGEVYATFLDIKRPFDIRDKKAYDIFTEFRGGRKPVVTTTGAMDWGEYSYEDLQEYVEDVAPNEYDGFILDEGADPDGNGGVVHRGLSFVPFTPNQIKSADPVTYDDNGNVIPLSERFNPKKEDIRYSLSAPVFYSNAEYAVRGIKQEKATPEQWLKMIEKAGGLKAGEDKWLGLSDWLKASDKKTLTKDEVLQYIAENDIQIEEVSYADVADISREEIYESAEFAELREGLTEYDEDGNPYINRERYDELRSESYDFVDGFSLDYWGEELEVDSPAAAATYLGLTKADKEINETRLNYATQGLSNKREIALTVPTIEPWNTHDDIHFGDAGEGRAVAWVRFGDAESPIQVPMSRRVEGFDAPFKTIGGQDFYAPENGQGKFSMDYVIYGRLKDGDSAYIVYINRKPISKHNTLEEARDAMNEYYKANPLMITRYDKVLVIDEIQSKRHQEGRDKGYIDADIKIAIEGAEERLRQANKALEIYRNSLKEKYGFKELKGSFFERIKMFEAALSAEELTEMERLGTERNDAEIAFNELASKRNGIPSAPFEKNWAELAFKRMLRYAAENGYDYVAWTTGDQQAERYNIGNVVSRVLSYPFEGNTKVIVNLENNSPLKMTVNSEGVVEQSNNGVEGATLAEVVGKELANKIINGEGEPATVYDGTDIEAKEISGDGLRIGGEGMRGFYDQMLPSFVKKYTKKWGAEVGVVTMPDLEENNTMHAVNVTDSMRESVMQGQPRFSLRSVDPYANYAKSVARELNIAQPIIVVDTKEEFVRLMREMGSKNPERGRNAKGMYRPADDAIFLNVESFDSHEDMYGTIIHEWVHAYTQRNKDELKSILNTLNEQYVKKAGNDILPDFYNNASGLTILNEIISNFVAGMPRKLLKAIMNGRISVDECVDGVLEDATNEPYGDILVAVSPIIKKNITNLKERYDGKREEPIVIARWSVQENTTEDERSQEYPYSNGERRSGDKGNFQPNAEIDRRRAREETQEVVPRYALPYIIDMTDEEAYKMQMLEIAQSMEQEASERNLDVAQEIVDRTGWVHLANGKWKYYGDIDLTDEAKKKRRVQRWLESKRAIAKARVRRMYYAIIEDLETRKYTIQDFEERVARLVFERDEALSEIDANHRATMEDFEQNPDKYERKYEESEARSAEIDLYKHTLSKAKHKLQSLENKMARASASERERKATIANIKRQIIAQLEGDLGRYAYKNDIRALINAVNEAQTTYAMLRAFDKAMRAMYELKLRKELSRMRNLTKMQIVAGDGSILDPRTFLNNMVAAGEMTQAMAHRTLQSFWGGFNNSGVPIAKGVDAETKELMEFIHQNSDYVTAMAQQKGDNARKYVETLRSELEADTTLTEEARDKRMAATYIIEQYLEAQETYGRIRMSKDAQTRQSDINALTKKIRSIKAEIAKVGKESVAVTKNEGVVAREDELKKLEAELNEELTSLLRERAENSDNYFGSMPDIITLLEEANASVITLLQEGKVELSKQKEAERKHRQELIHDALADMDGYIDAANSLGKEKTSMQKVREEAVSALTVPFKSIDHLLREMSKYAPNGEGRLWQRFIPVLFKATQNIHTNLRNSVKDINEMTAALFGKSYDQVVKLAETTVIGTFNVRSSAAKDVNPDGTTSTKPAIETRKLTVTLAMYILATWAQENGRRSLERDGFNDKTINEIRSRMREANPNWEVFVNWVVDSYLPSLRPKYSEAFKVLFGSKMPFVKKYFPLRRVGVAKPADIANEGPLPLPSTVTGSVISRTGSTASIDLNSSFFEVLQENVVEMEVWAEMAPIIKDFNILMSSPAVKNAMNAIREGFATDFRKAAKVATLSESLEHGEMEKYLMPLITKTWAGSKLAFKGYTALKQLSSSILFAGYSTDPEFIGILMWRYAMGGLPLPNKAMRNKIANGEIKLNAKDFFKVPLTRNILWAMEHSQAFANRWFSGAAGNETLAKKIADPKWQDKTWRTSVRKGVEEILSKGMLGIVVVDAFTVATGMRAIYDYEVEKGKSRGLTDAQAKELAIFKADYFANKTQQSSEGLLLSPMQTARDFISTTLSTFNNAPFAQGRIILESIRELLRNKEREIMHIEYEYQKRIVESRSSELDAEVEMMKQRGELTNKLDEEKYREGRTKQMMQEAYPDAHAYAMREIRRVRRTAKLRLFLNAYLGPLAFNAMAILPYLVFGDDDEKKWELVRTILWASIAGPLSAIPLGSAFLSLFTGYDFTVSGALSELERDINNIATYIRENGFDWTLMGLISDFAVRRTIGLDYRAVYNMYAGIEDMIQNGASAEGVMMAINAPMSQVRLIAGDRKDNETFKQYSERLMRLYTILQTPAYEEYFRNDRGLKTVEMPLGMEKWEMREIISSYEQQHRRDVMQQFGGERAYKAMLEAETEYAQIIENFGWTTRSVTPHVEDDGTLNSPVSGISEEEYRELIGLASAINRTDRMLQRFIGEDTSYYEVLSQMNNLRNQFIAKYHESIE